jgi:hypothetical protein
MIRKELFYWLCQSPGFHLNYDEFAKHNKPYNKVMDELLSESSTVKRARKEALKYIASSNNYNKFLEDWGAKNRIDPDVMNKSIKILDKVSLPNREQSNKFFYSISKKDTFRTEVNDPFYNVEREELFVFHLEKYFSLDELSDILSIIDDNCLFFLGPIVKTSVKLSPYLGATLIMYFSENESRITDLKNKLKKKVSDAKLMNRINDLQHFVVFTAGAFSSYFVFNLVQNKKPMGSYEIIKNTSEILWRKIGGLIGSSFVHLVYGASKDYFSVRAKIFIGQFVIAAKDYVVSIKETILSADKDKDTDKPTER